MGYRISLAECCEGHMAYLSAFRPWVLGKRICGLICSNGILRIAVSEEIHTNIAIENGHV